MSVLEIALAEGAHFIQLNLKIPLGKLTRDL